MSWTQPQISDQLFCRIEFREAISRHDEQTGGLLAETGNAEHTVEGFGIHFLRQTNQSLQILLAEFLLMQNLALQVFEQFRVAVRLMFECFDLVVQ